VDDVHLQIKGTDEDEAVAVEVDQITNDIVVRGLDGTTVNGSTDPFVAFEGTGTIPKNLAINLDSGSDRVEVRGLPGASLNIGGLATIDVRLGDDADEVKIQNVVVGGRLRVDTGGQPDPTTGVPPDGSDLVDIMSTAVSDNIKVLTGQGGDEVSIKGTTADLGLTVITLNGSDTLTFDDVAVQGFMKAITAGRDDHLEVTESTIVGNLVMLTRNGDDNVVIRNTDVEGAVRVITSHGDDHVEVIDSAVKKFEPDEEFEGVNGRLLVATLLDNDTVTARGVEVAGPMKVNLSRGDDILTLTEGSHNVFEGPVRVVGGTGFDTVRSDPEGNIFLEPDRVAFRATEVEIVEPGAVMGGRSVADWIGEWWNWLGETPNATNPRTDVDGTHAKAGQPEDSGVFYVADTTPEIGEVARTFDVGADQFLLVPLAHTTQFGSAGELSQTEESVNDLMDDVTDDIMAKIADDDQQNDIYLKIDGKTFGAEELLRYKESGQYRQTMEAGSVLADEVAGTTLPNTWDESYAAGYWVCLKLPEGTHTVEIGFGLVNDDGTIDRTVITDTINVVAP
jgi:hypothetical protein